MLNKTEQDEREYLEEIREKLALAARRIDDKVKQFSSELRQAKAYLHEHQSGMDEADMVATEQSINRMAFTGESAVETRRKLIKLQASPYFGRIDFSSDATEPAALYIGIYTFFDDTSGKNLIYDWRAPISSMFYDFGLGPAWYDTPSGRISGEIHLKRQYHIRDGRMEFMIENEMNINDDVLQRELSKASDEKMKAIVSTIQRDQNAIIRNESAPIMIIQGVAGSGKTSIALHRIAFLLYRFRDTIEAKDILILSPNKVFADYISNVLPELGEAHIPEMGIDELAQDLFENKYRFQTSFQQAAALMESTDSRFAERVRFKSDFEFLRKLNQYLIQVENNFFQPMDLRVGRTVVPNPYIEERFRAYYRLPILKRIPSVVKDVQQYVRTQVERKLHGQEKAAIWQAVPRMIRFSDVLDLYKGFYDSIGRPDLFFMPGGNTLEFADVFPLLYCKIRVEGVQPYDHVKHLLVDEMQDYTPVQYRVLSRLFSCNMTILGDATQAVNPYTTSTAEAIHEVFPQGHVVKLVRSYRSTSEIIGFAQRIIPNPDLIAMERHGEEPQVVRLESDTEELSAIRKQVSEFKNSGRRSMAIIVKTQKRSRFLFEQLKQPGVYLITPESAALKSGIVITTANLAKGLEFDEVLVPFANASEYATELDRRLLYVACTRAMHLLTLTYNGEFTKLVG